MKLLLVLQHLEIEGPGLFEQFAREKDLQNYIHWEKDLVILKFKKLIMALCTRKEIPSIKLHR